MRMVEGRNLVVGVQGSINIQKLCLRLRCRMFPFTLIGMSLTGDAHAKLISLRSSALD
jgi:hypothetical protein